MSDEYPTWSDFKADLVFDEELQAFVHRPDWDLPVSCQHGLINCTSCD